MKRLKILMISPFPPQISGGSKASYYFYHYLQKFHNFQIEVLTYQNFPNRKLKVRSVKLKGKQSVIRGISFLILGFIRGLFFTRKFKPDIIYSKQLMTPSICGYFLSKVLRIPLVSHTAGPDIQDLTFMASNVPKILSRIYFIIISYVRKKILEYSSAIICNCKADFLALQEVYRNSKSTIIYNGVSLHKFQFDSEKRKEIRQKYGIQKSDSVIIYTGQANKQKQTDKLLLIAKENSNKKFLIVGPLEEELIEFGTISENVIITGQILQNIEYYYSAADIFILPSKHEGLSNSLLEALSMNLPVIVTPVGEARFLIDHKINGILSDVENFSYWIDELHHNRELCEKLSNNSRQLIKDKYNWRISTKKMSKLFKKL